MQKTIFYLLVLVILGAGVYYFVFKEHDLYSKDEAAFTVKDVNELGKIFLASSSGRSITLIRTDTGWVMPQGYRVRQGTLDNLLRVLHTQEAKYPVPESQHNMVVKVLAGSSVKVELYDREGEKMNSFFVGGSAGNYSGTYMLQEHAKRPYVVQIPNFDGFLTPSYSTDIDDWRDRSVINLQPDEVKHFSIQYAQDSGYSFAIDFSGDKPVVTSSGQPAGPLNERRVRVYQKYFSENYCEGYLNGIDDLDSIIASVPLFCQMDVTARNGWHQHIDIYKMPLNKRSKNLRVAKEGDYDIDRFYGVINNYRDTVLMQAFTFDKFFRRAQDFYVEDPSVELMKGNIKTNNPSQN